MPDSEHSTGDDPRDVPQGTSDESTPVERRTGTSTTPRPVRPVKPRRLGGTSSDPRTEGTRPVPRRPVTNGADPGDEAEVDVAAALARLPDTDDVADHATVAPADEDAPSGDDQRSHTSNGSGSNGSGSNGSSTNGSGNTPSTRAERRRRPPRATPEADVIDPGLVVTAESVLSSVIPDATTTPDVADTPDNTDTTDTVENDTDAAEALVEVEEPDTEVIPVVDDLRETEIIPVVEPAEPVPHLYDVEADEPGAYVALVPAIPDPLELEEAPRTQTVPAIVEPVTEQPTRRRRRRPRVRRVTRVVRHVDTWTVFKVAAVFTIVFYASALISGVLLWNVAVGTGTVDNVERFMESFGWESFEFHGDEIFDAAWRLGLFVALALTGLAVLAATTFNLVTDLVGGIRVTVLEEEVVVAAPAMPKRS